MAVGVTLVRVGRVRVKGEWTLEGRKGVHGKGRGTAEREVARGEGGGNSTDTGEEGDGVRGGITA